MLLLKDIEFNYRNGGGAFNVCIDELKFDSSLITCVLGKNGSGKTTVLNLIGGHLQSEKGKIVLSGEDISSLKAEFRPTSTVFQQIGLFPHLTVKENIELAIEPNTLFKKSAVTKNKAKKILVDFSLTEFEKRKPSELSVGQQQRVAIARALSSDPKVLLLDEPTSALDFANISILKSMLKEIKERQPVPVIIIVSHDLHFVLETADSIKFIEDGRFVFQGSTEEFKKSKYYIN
jgi:ABC-type Fe3+/spermidine/putrescine transport system ATPase subunit